ncbi:MAG: T9SS type A sorting domain-containing protein [Bacteroidales bacterium]|nr:T9SS type A sorting domain-containing protein [Bacteroidales bacterium]MCF8458757.1 T9SS type A sorting domain-containing protein [Bacteroidales bacterium]
MKKNLILSVLLLVTVSQCYAQWGSNDSTFNSTDLGYGYCDGANNDVLTTIIQSDGKIIIGGRFTQFAGVSVNHIARLNINGSLDSTFDPGTGPNGYVYSSTVQSDGKIIIGGSFSNFNGTASSRIARLNSDGSLDTTFIPGTGANDVVYAIDIQSTGKILIGGDFTSYNGISKNRIARLNNDGSIDATFLSGTGANDGIRTIVQQSDGKIFIGGNFFSYNGSTKNKIARLNVNGSLDATFSGGYGTNLLDYIYSISVQTDGKVIIGGNFTNYPATGIRYLVRLNSTGSLDTSFDMGTGVWGEVRSTSIQSDGKIVIGGDFFSINSTQRNKIARLYSNGSVDTGFDPGIGANYRVWTTNIQSDGKIIVGGEFETIDGGGMKYLNRLLANGNLDESFYAGTGANGEVLTTSLQNDGKIIIGGKFSTFGGKNRIGIARLDQNGDIDLSFNPAMGDKRWVYAIALLNNGKIIIGGSFDYNLGTYTAQNIARLNANGSVDATFNTDDGVSGNVRAVAIQDNGKILVGGQIWDYNGIAKYDILRLTASGYLDVSFDSGTGLSTNCYIYSISLQNDGKIMIGGNFTSYDGTARNKIARLNTDGSIDTSFDPGTGAYNTVYATAIQDNGKILIGGDFGSYNGISSPRVARLNMDGSLDNTFNIGTGANGSVRSITLQSDGKIIIGGDFTSFNGTTINRVARLNSDGSLDTLFAPAIGASDIVYSTTLQSEGKIIIGGDFTSYDGVGRSRVARILACANFLLSETATICNGETYTWHGIGYTATGMYYDTLNASNGCDSIFELSLTVNTIDTNVSVSGALLSANTLADAYQWVDCDNAFAPIIGATSQSYTATTIGNYAVIITSGVCSDTSACVPITTIGILSPQIEEGISIYPIPFSDEFIIEIEGNHEKLNFEILNTLGQVVLNGNMIDKTRVQTSRLAPGVYFVKIDGLPAGQVGGKSFVVKKLIKE